MIYVVLLWFNCFSILVLFVYLSDFWCVCVEHVLRCVVCCMCDNDNRVNRGVVRAEGTVGRGNERVCVRMS